MFHQICGAHSTRLNGYVSLCGKFHEETLHLTFQICRWSGRDGFCVKLNLGSEFK